MQTIERRFWQNGFKKREFGWQYSIGMFGYGVVWFRGYSGWNVVNYYLIVE